MSLKRIVTEDCSVGGVPAEILREISILRLLTQSPYILNVLSIDHNMETSSIVLKFDCEEEGVDTLQNYMTRRLRLPISEEVELCSVFTTIIYSPLVQKLIFQLFCGLSHCHERGIVHRSVINTCSSF
jgi:cyclin-dependent kinase